MAGCSWQELSIQRLHLFREDDEDKVADAQGDVPSHCESVVDEGRDARHDGTPQDDGPCFIYVPMMWQTFEMTPNIANWNFVTWATFSMKK